MCAIGGTVDLAYDQQVLDAMQETMKHRGPDGQGRIFGEGFALLHTRLAIVDPEGGAQPMELCRGEERYSIVYNGELYNTPELRAELTALGHRFLGHSDTEVVLHAYVQWKEECLTRFNGIFGLAVWESKKRKLFLARDRIGVKPLFYKLHNAGMIFASEMKTVLAYPGVQPILDETGVAQLLLLGPGRVPGSGVLKDIMELEPGCCGVYENGKWHSWRYWYLRDGIHRDSFEQTAEKVRYLVTDSIKRQMVSDVPLGTFLSGGLDSSLISSVCARQLQQPLDTFSVDYENNELYFVPGKFQPESDARYIDLMQRYLKSKHHRTVLTPQQLSDTLEAATVARDLPGMADVDFSLLAFCKDVRKTVKMALSGECADEIFGGYPWYRDPEVRSADGFPWAQNTDLRASFLLPSLREIQKPEEFVMDQYNRTVAQSDILPENTPLERRMKEMVNLNMRWFMQTLLDRKDRMSMYNGLEVRVPFCDYRIAEYLYTVPWAFKDYQGREKGLLRYAMRDWLPDPVLHRKKSPYPKTWAPAYQQLMEQRLLKLLEQKNAPIFYFVDPQAIRKLLQAEYTWPWYGQLMKVPQTMAYILQIDFWLRHNGIAFAF
ncbi:MAG: asparagine synthase (glutamine-hydrolyzing) [Oscillospiraceae bacterium]|nr:asparagine synthase (glutamine-hydrolyzing) [Oscillospiraceae bacterium]